VQTWRKPTNPEAPETKSKTKDGAWKTGEWDRYIIIDDRSAGRMAVVESKRLAMTQRTSTSSDVLEECLLCRKQAEVK
jgi:hypothetical protein